VIYGNKNSMYGAMAISVDGVTKAIVDVYSPICTPSPGNGSIPLYTVNESGKHTVRVAVAGKPDGSPSTDNYIVFDKVVVSPEPVMTAGVYGSQNPDIRYSNPMSFATHADSSCMNGVTVQSNDVGQYYEFTYNGNSAVIYGNKNSMYGQMGISVDGGPVTYVNVYAAQCTPEPGNGSIALYSVPNSGLHTVRVYVAGRPDGSPSTDNYIVFDKVIVN